MGLGLWHSSRFSLEHCTVCPSKAPVLPHGCKQPAVPRGSRTASTAPAPPPPHPEQGAHSFFTFLMQKELEANSLHFLCSKRETGKKRKGTAGGSIRVVANISTCPSASRRASAALQAVPNGLHSPGLCMTGGDRANPAVTRAWDSTLTGDVTSLT